ncbi:SpaA isopeptide-forming pilin-related protein [Clostridium sp.]|uniref:SpaA isopeptide-forming pilin-related protein n=1 Tax=Clostridium sp. TaxID=1506 RepID=UPI002639A553
MERLKRFISLFTIFMMGLSVLPKDFITFAQDNNKFTIESNLINGNEIVIIDAKDKDGKKILVYNPSTGNFSKQHIVGISKILLNGKPVYCLEPEVGVNTKNLDGYKAEDFKNSNLKLTSNQEEKIALYSHYGYGNPDNKDCTDNNWYIATQILIWEELGYKDFSQLYILDKNHYAYPYWDSQKVESMKKQIKDKVDLYYKNKKFKPDFYYNNLEIKDNTINVKKSDLIKGIDITEKNNKLNIYKEITSSKDIKASIKDNKIHIVAKNNNLNNVEDVTLNLIRHQDIGKRYVEVLDKSQKIGVLNLNENDQKSEVLKLNVIDDLSKEVLFSKVEVNGTKELVGAKLKVVEGESQSGKLVKEWTSSETQEKIKLKKGVYTMIETQAPNGYDKAESITFRVTSEGKLEVKENGNWISKENSTVKMVDALKQLTLNPAKTKVSVTKKWKGIKKDRAPEVKVFLYKNGQKTDKSITLNKNNNWSGEFTDLPVVDNVIDKTGITYTVQEEGTVSGKVEIENNTYNVNVTGDSKTGYTITNVYLPVEKEVYFSKVEVNGTEELVGAKLKVVEGEDESGKLVKEWTSSKTQEKLKLKEGVYTMIETQAPNGYEKAESITFGVTHEGKLEVKENGKWISKENSTVKMIDGYSDQTVKFSKRDVAGKELEGATIQLQKEDGSLVEEWVSTGEEKKFIVKPGSYKLVETAAPNGYEVATAINFTIDKDGKVVADGKEVKGDALIVMVDGYSLSPLINFISDKDGKVLDDGAEVKGDAPVVMVDKYMEKVDDCEDTAKPEKIKTSENTKVKSNLPKTGEASSGIEYFAIILICSIALLILGKKSKKDISNTRS